MTDTLANSTKGFLNKQVNELGQALNVIIANGSASFDTIRNYRNQMIHFVKWCGYNGINLVRATEFNIEQYRHHLQNKRFKPRTIALKLTVVRRLYDAAIKLGWISINPALNVRAKSERKQIGDNNNYLLEQEAQKLISYLPDDNSLAGLRDRLLVSLMVVCGLRQIELHRLKIKDINWRSDGKVGLKVFAKGSERTVPLKPKLIDLLKRYLEVRKKVARERAAIEREKASSNKVARIARKKPVDKVDRDSPVFISLASNHYGEALSRRTMQIVANRYLEEAELKENDSRTVTTHGLRHTVGYLMTLAGKPLRVIQDYLGHADPKTTSIYAHTVNLWHNNPTLSINLLN